MELELKILCCLKAFMRKFRFKVHQYLQSHTQYTLLRSSVACQLGATSSIGHHQVIIQGYKCIQKLRNIK